MAILWQSISNVWIVLEWKGQCSVKEYICLIMLLYYDYVSGLKRQCIFLSQYIAGTTSAISENMDFAGCVVASERHVRWDHFEQDTTRVSVQNRDVQSVNRAPFVGQSNTTVLNTDQKMLGCVNGCAY